MKKITSKKLLNYGAMSAAILGTAGATGQVVYTDIPDELLDVATEDLGIDFNNDNVDDIILSYRIFNGGNAAVVYPGSSASASSNAFFGQVAGNFNYPSNLSDGATIDGSALTNPGGRGDLYFYNCYSNSQWCGDTGEGFIGVAIEVSGATHYAWVRIDIASNGAGGAGSILVKDFAFEATPDTPITAGDGILSIEDNVFEGFDFVVSNDVLTLRSASAMDNVQIFNILGQEVINQRLSSTSENISTSAISPGVYIASVVIEGQTRSFKFVKR